MHTNDLVSFDSFALSLKNSLVPCSHEAAWIVRGEYRLINRITGSTWVRVSLHMATSNDTITGRVLDSLDPSPNLSDLMLYPAAGASDVLKRLFRWAPFLQMPGAASHQQLKSDRTASIYHAMLNVAAVLGRKALPSDDGVCEILAAALQVHFVFA